MAFHKWYIIRDGCPSPAREIVQDDQFKFSLTKSEDRMAANVASTACD